MAEVGGVAAGLTSIDGYPNGPNTQALVMLVAVVVMDLFTIVVMWMVAGVRGIPYIAFVLACTVGFCYFNIKAQYLMAPVKVGVERNGLRFIYRKGNEEIIGWERIADISNNFGGKPGATVVQLVDRFIPVKIPHEVMEQAKPLLEEDESAAEKRSTLQNPDLRTRRSKNALRGKNNGRKLMIIMGISIPFIVLLALLTTFWF